MGKVSENAHYYIVGFGLYYALRWIFVWFPAAICGLYISQQTDQSWGEDGAMWSGIIFMLVIYLFLKVLIVLQRYETVIFC